MCKFYRWGWVNAYCKVLDSPISASRDTEQYCAGQNNCQAIMKAQVKQEKFQNFLESKKGG